MLDTKSRIVLSILASESKNGTYKIFEISDIILSMPKHYRVDNEAIKHILTYLERQDIISIKYDDEDKYCLSVLPYGFEILENEKPQKIVSKQKKEFGLKSYTISFISAFLGSILGVLLCKFVFRM